MSLTLKIAVLIILVLINAFFAMSEMAVVSLNDTKIKKMASNGHKKAKKIVKLTSDSAGFLSTIQIGVTLAGFLTSASASQNFARKLYNLLAERFSVSTSMGESAIYVASVVIITLITSYFSLVFGELVPKKIAMHKSEPIAFAVVGFLLVFKKIMAPVVFILTKSTNLITRLFRINPGAFEEQVTEEEILMLVDVGEEKGVIEESQREMINNIFEFDDIDVRDVMRHRTEIAALDASSPLADAVDMAIEQGYSRIPVFEEDLDNIIGVIYAKDLLRFVGRHIPKNAVAQDIMRPAYHIPESKMCGELFKEMTEKRIQIAVVVDEYGGTAGLITLEDLIESIVGNIQDEYDNEEDEITVVNENTYTIDGTCDIDEVEDMLDTTFPEGDYDTLGGLIMTTIGRIPEDDERPAIEVSGFRFTVLSIEDRRIGQVRAERIVQSKIEDDTE